MENERNNKNYDFGITTNYDSLQSLEAIQDLNRGVDEYEENLISSLESIVCEEKLWD